MAQIDVREQAEHDDDRDRGEHRATLASATDVYRCRWHRFLYALPLHRFPLELHLPVPLVEVEVLSVDLHLTPLKVRRLAPQRPLRRHELVAVIEIHDQPVRILVPEVE